MASNPIIDEDMVNEVVKIGFDRETVIHSIKTRQQDKVQDQLSTLLVLPTHDSYDVVRALYVDLVQVKLCSRHRPFDDA